MSAIYLARRPAALPHRETVARLACDSEMKVCCWTGVGADSPG